jgi:hypothetical protein
MYMFRAVMEIETFESYWHKDVVSGDVNGDGRDDVIFSTSTNLAILKPYESEFYGLGILLQNADGTLAAPIYLYREWPASASNQVLERGGLVLADFNRDGIKDIVVSHGAGLEFVSGSRTGNFSARSFSGAYTAPAHELVSMDVNGDGNLDVVAHTMASATDYTQGIGVYFGNGMGEVASRSFTAVAFPFAGLAAGDLNRDGLKDIATGFTEAEGEADAGGVAVFLNNGSGAFAPPRKYNALDLGSSGVTIGDFNADGRNDVVVGQIRYLDISNLSMFLQDAAGQLAAPVALRTASTPAAMLGTDMNGDGRDDLLVAHLGPWALGYLQQGTGGLAGEIKYRIPPLEYRQVSSIAVGDVNSDGYKDAISVRAGHAVIVLYGTGKREGIRANGGQPLVIGGAAAVPVPSYQSNPAVLPGPARQQPTEVPVSLRERVDRAIMKWPNPIRESPFSTSLRFVATAVVENYSAVFSRIQAAAILSHASQARSQPASVSRHRIAASASVQGTLGRPVKAGQARVPYRSICIGEP